MYNKHIGKEMEEHEEEISKLSREINSLVDEKEVREFRLDGMKRNYPTTYKLYKEGFFEGGKEC